MTSKQLPKTAMIPFQREKTGHITVVAGLAKEKVEAIVGVLGADVLHRKHTVVGYARSIILLSH